MTRKMRMKSSVVSTIEPFQQVLILLNRSLPLYTTPQRDSTSIAAPPLHERSRRCRRLSRDITRYRHKILAWTQGKAFLMGIQARRKALWNNIRKRTGICMCAEYHSRPSNRKLRKESNIANLIVLSSSHCTTSLGLQEQLAGQRELCAAVDVHDPPVSLVTTRSAITRGVRLPGLVECLEDEDVDAP